METTSLKDRMKLQEEAIFEDDMDNVQDDEGMSDEDLKIESLKIATNIAKLMSNVTTEDIVSIAETIAKFIKGGSESELEVSTDESEGEEENPEDSEEEFSTDEEETEETSEPEEKEEESEENFEV